LRFLNLVEEFYRNQDSFGSLSVLHTLHLQRDVKLVLNFPDEDGRYEETDSIVFSPMQRTDAAELSNMSGDIENFALGTRVQFVCDFMLSHLRQLRQANIDYDRLTRVVERSPISEPLGYFP